MTSNHWEDVFVDTFNLDFVDSYFLAVTLARKVGEYRDMMSFEVEVQAVKHFDYMASPGSAVGVLRGDWGNR